MTGLDMLWLPILLSSVFVFVASSIIHMLTPWHKSDYPKLANESKVLDALRPLAIPPGDYVMPRAESMKEMSSPEFVEKQKRRAGCRDDRLSERPGFNGEKPYPLVPLFHGRGSSLPHTSPGVPCRPDRAYYLSQVFRFAGATAFVGYSLALWQMSIWYRRSWKTTLKSTIDGLIYGLLTAGVFGGLASAARKTGISSKSTLRKRRLF